MRALPARRIALGALCAALLVTITGPAALAADTHPGQDPAASLVARLPQTDTARTDLAPVTDLVRAVLAAPDGRLPLAEARRLADAARVAVDRAAADDPVTVTTTVTTHTSTPAAAPTTPLLPGLPAPVTSVLAPMTAEDDGTDSALGAVREALDGLLDLLLPTSDQTAAGTTTTTTETSSTSQTSVTGTTETTDAAAAETAADAAAASTDELLARVDELLDALTGADPQTATTLPAPVDPADPAEPADPADPAEPADPADPVEPATSSGVLPVLTSLLLPNS